MGLNVAILPVVTKDLSISPLFTPYKFLSRCKFSTLTTRQSMIEFYLLTFGRKNTNSGDKNRTHDFRTSRCADYLLDHSGDEGKYTRLMSLHYNNSVVADTFSMLNSVFVCVFVCVVIPFILDIRLVDAPAGVTQEEGHK